MNVMAIAGASFPCGVRGLAQVALRHDYDPILLDHPHNSVPADQSCFSIRYETGIPADVAQRGGVLIPVLESWVSEGRRLENGSHLRFDRYAASVSRSKLALSRILSQAGIAAVPRIPVGEIEQALDAASIWGYPVVLRTDAGYSSRGVWVADSEDSLRILWDYKSVERAYADIAAMRLIMRETHDQILVEPWLSGDEWSVDCVIGPAGVSPIRICEKASNIVGGKPITLGYRITDSAAIWTDVRQAVERWTNLLCPAREVSFACFDIRRHSNGELVPLDFGVRLGGDGIPLLVHRAGGAINAYAAALDAILAGDPSRLGEVKGCFSLVHAFARQEGVFEGVSTDSGEVVDAKETGLRIVSRGPMGAIRRVGSIITTFTTRERFLDACHRSSEWIHVSYSKG